MNQSVLIRVYFMILGVLNKSENVLISCMANIDIAVRDSAKCSFFTNISLQVRP